MFSHSVVQKVQAAVAVSGDLSHLIVAHRDPYQDRLYNAVKDTAYIQAIQRDAREQTKVLFVEEAWWILNGRTRP